MSGRVDRSDRTVTKPRSAGQQDRSDGARTGTRIWSMRSMSRPRCRRTEGVLPRGLSQALVCEPGAGCRRTSMRGSSRTMSSVRTRVGCVVVDMAGSWSHPRRIAIKAEVVRLGDREPRDKPAFRRDERASDAALPAREVYRARGDVENGVKELRACSSTAPDCQQFEPNQFTRRADCRRLRADAGPAAGPPAPRAPVRRRGACATDC